MIKSRLTVLLVAIAIGLSGCYNAKVTTGLEPSAKKIEDTFASGWIYGLVPPKTVEAANQCTNGVAIVETKLSFVNQLVSLLTIGIYTPMSIEITCASISASANFDKLSKDYTLMSASSKSLVEDFQRAAEQAVQTQKPVYLKTNPTN